MRTAKWATASLVSVLAASALAACGTTVAGGAHGAAGAGGAGSLEAGSQALTSSGAAGSALAGSAAAGLGGGAGSAGSGATGPAGSAAAGTTLTPAQAAAARAAAGKSGLVPAVFKLGVMASSNANAVLAAMGSGGANADADDAATRAFVAYFNNHGGIAGRPLVLDVNNVDATATPQAESEAACTQWTQDDHVTLAVPSSAVEDNDVLRTCLAKANTPALLGPIYSNTVAAGFASSPLWAEIETMPTEGYARTYVRGLAAQGFFSSGKVGVVYYDGPPFSNTLNSVLIPELKAAGVTDPVTAGASINGASDLSSGAPQMSSAVLKFRAAGVTKVLFFEPWVGYFSFLQAARSQGYAPTYGLSSQEAPEVARQLGLISSDELTGARLVSWTPVGDVGSSVYTGPLLGPLTPLCASIIRAAGVTPATPASRLDYALQFGGCEALFELQAIYAHAGPVLTPADFTRGLEALGGGLPLALKPVGSFFPGKHYAVTQYWNGHFDTPCGCFVYDGGPHPTSGAS